MSLLIFYIALAIGVSFLCSILEAVLLSMTPSYLYSLKESKPSLYKRLAPLQKDIERPLAAILTLNTIAHTIGAAGAGAKAQQIYGDEFITVFSAILTFLILVLSEIIPKSIGARYWKGLTGFAARVLPPLITISLPFVFLTRVISKLIKGKEEAPVSRDEIEALVDMGGEFGTLEEKEHLFLSRLIDHYHSKVEEVFLPATSVTTLNESLGVHDFAKNTELPVFSRYPTFKESVDQVTGYVLRQDVLLQSALDRPIEVGELVKPVLRVRPEFKLKSLLIVFLRRKEHLAIVEDVDHRFIGIITLEDVIETLLGVDIKDEADR